MSSLNLSKRYYYCSNGYCYNRVRPWWIVLIVLIPLASILFIILLRRRNLIRRNQGMQPVPYTGWTTYGVPAQPQYQQPYYNQNQEQGQNNYGQGYVNQNVEPKPGDDLPTYQESNQTNTNGNNYYQRPQGTPPNWQSPSVPPQIYSRP